MRGALFLAELCITGWGIIPADAGSTKIRLGAALGAPDHPRGCGEHLEPTGVMSILGGSSPRMRGAHSLPVGAGGRPRIIPADAGSTRSRRSAD